MRRRGLWYTPTQMGSVAQQIGFLTTELKLRHNMCKIFILHPGTAMLHGSIGSRSEEWGAIANLDWDSGET
jgi:hypothetical protein